MVQALKLDAAQVEERRERTYDEVKRTSIANLDHSDSFAAWLAAGCWWPSARLTSASIDPEVHKELIGF